MVDTDTVQVRPLAIDGAFEVTPVQHADDRGVFLEWFKASTFRDAVGRDFDLAQANCSVSGAGAVRGIHWADVPPGQAKYVTCVKGSLLDVVVDLRMGSPTFGRWDGVTLDDRNRRAMFIDEGLGHAFMALEPNTTIVYLCSTPYAPERERTVHALDAAIGVTWPTVAPDGSRFEVVLSARDAAAPTLATAEAADLLPVYLSTR